MFRLAQLAGKSDKQSDRQAAAKDGRRELSQESVIEALRAVFDPEIPVNIFDLGLVYSFDIDPEGGVDIRMTLTAPACPVAEILPQQVKNAVLEQAGASRVDVELVWDPPWSVERMSEEARLQLGL
jgi:FeS assembly SUF system protein